MPPRKAAAEILEALSRNLEALRNEAVTYSLTASQRKDLNNEIMRVSQKLDQLLKDIDPIKQPSAMFDPGNPDLVGRFVALAMVAQPRVPLIEIDDFYGAGVYAILR